jgi:hypothetical protein
MNWHKINWKKVSEIEKSCDSGYDGFDYDKFWKTMSKVSGMKLEQDESNFTWEDGYKAGLPRKDEGFYLVYSLEGDALQIGIYDDKQDYDPCFWSENYDKCFHPDYWVEIEKPEIT